MAKRRQQYVFKIDAFTPETIPMARLAEYMTELATLLGIRDSVHFLRVEGGSTTLVHEIEFEAVPKVRERINAIKTRTAPEDAIRAFANLDQKLAEDNGTGALETNATRIIEFPGRHRGQLEKFSPVIQPGSIDGVLIRVGGRDETVPVYLLEGDTLHKCNSNREVAKRLAPHLFGSTLRANGTGKWSRDDFGNWVMERFNIADFVVLDDSSLVEAVSKLRSIKTDLQSIDDPLEELRRIRRGSEKVQ
jgi:hypothetical protein